MPLKDIFLTNYTKTKLITINIEKHINNNKTKVTKFKIITI